MRHCLVLLLVALLGACSALPPLPQWQASEGLDHPALGQIRDLHSGQLLEPRQLVRRLAAAERVLIGERHDNPDHHALQLWLLQAMAQQRRQGSLLLEMLVPAQQPLVDQARAAIADGQRRAELPARLDWSDGWPWSLYGPLVEYGLRQPGSLLAANLDRDEIGRLYRQPVTLSGARSTHPAVRDALGAQIRASHCGMLPESQVPAMVAIQQQRDRRMAERLLAAPAPALLLAGGFHVRRDLGVPQHLVDLEGAAQVLLLAEVGQAVDARQADFVWFTPAQPQDDPCAVFRKGGR